MKLKYLALPLALELAFSICFFFSIFLNLPATVQKLDANHHYFINRGYPIAWSGTSAENKVVELPLIKAPFIARDLGDARIWSKIIDLRVLLPFLFATMLITYPLMLLILKAFENGKKVNSIFLIISNSLLLLSCLFFYFFWFPRI